MSVLSPPAVAPSAVAPSAAPSRFASLRSLHYVGLSPAGTPSTYASTAGCRTWHQAAVVSSMQGVFS